MKKDFDIDTQPQNMLQDKENINRGAPKKQESKKLTKYTKVGFTTGEWERLEQEYNNSEFASFSSFLRYSILRD